MMHVPMEDRGVEPIEEEASNDAESAEAQGAADVGERAPDGTGGPAAIEDDRGGD